MKVVNSIFVFLLLVGIAYSHLCLFSPQQRGSGPPLITGPGSDDCFNPVRQSNACGSKNAGAVVATLGVNSYYSVHFQQNFNHWMKSNPGFMDISLSYDGQTFKQLEVIPDFNAFDMWTQTNFTIPILVPSTPCDSCVIRVRYVPNNPLEPPMGFVQCADVQIA
ncbi:hypothetical protein CYY_007445 [Polysphondylium violaceum]|uniref:F5/8 type C domain-containing protein n=1 Tax=Polysphondylium violaceum TaxID=133409 RepID=A0A8J4PPR2_9MYCE|nr:hypothetical protein CYY_007445 [Polysphondylium violaceum]